MVFLGHLVINFVGFLFMLIAGGVAFAVVIALEQAGASMYSSFFCGLHAGALVAGLLGVAYDRHSGLGLFESYKRYLEWIATGRAHPGRIAWGQAPLALYPITLLLMFLLFWACGILVGLTPKKAVEFLLMSFTTIAICAAAQAIAKILETPTSQKFDSL